eukprot:scaffold38047_cov32-Tisochrysis_lutea.AAC.7
MQHARTRRVPVMRIQVPKDMVVKEFVWQVASKIASSAWAESAVASAPPVSCRFTSREGDSQKR